MLCIGYAKSAPDEGFFPRRHPSSVTNALRAAGVQASRNYFPIRPPFANQRKAPTRPLS